MSTLPPTLQILSISTSLLASGALASITFFSVPSFLALPASQSLPQTRWLFSRGSHIFPPAAILTSTSFFSLAYTFLRPLGSRGAFEILLALGKGGGGATFNGYILAGLLCIGIAPVTQVMIPTNFQLIGMNEEKGGARSEKSASKKGQDPVEGKGQLGQFAEVGQFLDTSGPQKGTWEGSTEEEDRRVRELLQKFGRLNLVRAGCIGLGGVVGLVTALMGGK